MPNFTAKVDCRFGMCLVWRDFFSWSYAWKRRNFYLCKNVYGFYSWAHMSLHRSVYPSLGQPEGKITPPSECTWKLRAGYSSVCIWILAGPESWHRALEKEIQTQPNLDWNLTPVYIAKPKQSQRLHTQFPEQSNSICFGLTKTVHSATPHIPWTTFSKRYGKFRCALSQYSNWYCHGPLGYVLSIDAPSPSI